MTAILLPFRGGVVLTAAWSVSERYEGDGIIVSFVHDYGNPYKSVQKPETAVFPHISMVRFLDLVRYAHKSGQAFVDLANGRT